MEQQHDNIIRMQSDITYIKDAVREIKEGQQFFVTRQEFWPVKTLVYGCVALMLAGMVGYGITMSLRTPVSASGTIIK